MGDMQSIDGNADASVDARVRKGWNKFRQLVPLLTNKDVSIRMREKLYRSFARSSIIIIIILYYAKTGSTQIQ